jgi:hypothetical protein
MRRSSHRTKAPGTVLCPVCEDVSLLPAHLPVHLVTEHEFEWEQRRRNPNDYATQAVRQILGYLPESGRDWAGRRR